MPVNIKSIESKEVINENLIKNTSAVIIPIKPNSFFCEIQENNPINPVDCEPSISEPFQSLELCCQPILLCAISYIMWRIIIFRMQKWKADSGHSFHFSCRLLHKLFGFVTSYFYLVAHSCRVSGALDETFISRSFKTLNYLIQGAVAESVESNGYLILFII